MPYHLPILLNPLVNSVFNCPTPSTSPLKKIFASLRDQRFILVVPNVNILLHYQDLDTGSSLQDLCYTYEFVANHIIILKKDSKHSDQEFKTLNGKTVLIRSQNGIVLTGDGFPSKRRCKITNTELFINFNDYLKGSKYFPLIHIDKPLMSDAVKNDELQVFGVRSTNTSSLPLSTDLTQREVSSFEQLFRLHPQLGDRFSGLFKEQRQKINANFKDLDSLVDFFDKFNYEAFELIRHERRFENHSKLHQTVHNYVELNLYDDIWKQITQLYRDDEIEATYDYNLLKYIAISQVPTPFYPEKQSKFSLKKVTHFEKSLEQATDCFKRLTFSSSHSEKTKIIMDTLQTLTDYSEFPDADIEDVTIDADTLIGLMVLVVCRSQVKNLKSHLFYLQNFSLDENSIKFGVVAYALSTLEAVLCYFEDAENSGKIRSLEFNCRRNKQFWDHLSCKAVSLDSLKSYRDILKIRTAGGESCLSICIQKGNFSGIECLLQNFEHELPLEDILDDQTINGSTLLMQTLETGNTRMADVLLEILCQSCTINELREYLNRRNRWKRTAAHYLTQDLQMADKIGIFFDWEAKDVSGHTPLFAIFRSYDHPDYAQMVTNAFRTASKWYEIRGENFNFSAHKDTKGNTLLHVMKTNIEILLEQENIDVNEVNKKGLTPLMVYVKYNRLDNVKCILRDNRLIMEKRQKPLFLNCFDYVKNPVIQAELGFHAAERAKFGEVVAHTFRFENNRWFLWITLKGKDHETDFQTVKHNIRAIQGLLQVYLRRNPMSFLPIDAVLEDLHEIGKTGLVSIGKLEVHRFLCELTLVLKLICQKEEFKKALYLPAPDLVNWIRESGRKRTNVSRQRIEPEEINSIQSFLRFNLSELSLIRDKISILQKLSIFSELKAQDINQARCMLFSQSMRLEDTAISQAFGISGLSEKDSEDLAATILTSNIDFLKECTNKLVGKIDQLLQGKLTRWWKLYAELLDARNQYNKNFPNSVKPHLDDNKGLFGTYVEGKRSKLEEKLSAQIKSCLERLQTLTYEVKQEHEALAEELSIYLEFKTNYLRTGIIQDFTVGKINTLKDTMRHFKRSLRNYKEQGYT